MLSPVICIVVILAVFTAYTRGSIFDDLFNPGLEKKPKFSDSQLYLLDEDNSIAIDDINGHIGCFGDFNSDKYTDLFIIVGNNSETIVNVYLWDQDNWQFSNSSAFVAFPYITNLAAGDFNYDGKLDLMVSGKNISTNNTYVRIYLGDLKELAKMPMTVIENAASQVTIMDANNDMKLDLFGEIVEYDYNTTTPNNTIVTKTIRRAFWINKGAGVFTVAYDRYDAPLMSPHSSAFVDIDGDCLADRFVVSQDANGDPQYELLLNQKNKGFNPPTGFSPVKLPKGSGQISFADFDRDGNLDFIIPVCYPAPNCTKENSIKVIFNKQKPMCSLLTRNSNCRSSTALCTADSNFHLGDFNNTDDPYYQEAIISNEDGDHFYFDQDNDRPLTLRVGDFNSDGYPDLLIPIIGKTGPSRVELWQNVASNSGRRTFSKVTSGADALTAIPNAYAGAFFDLDEDGVVDMFVLADNPPRIETVFNNFENDAFFLKALGLNGVCPEWCTTKPKFPSPKPYGVNYVGAVFKYTYTDLSGKTQIATGTQLPQSAYLALNTPYILFGLGRTSNYIEQFFYGVPLNQSVHYNYWTGSTIPNSQVVAVPYKPENPAGWTLELYITPSGLLFWIMIALVISLLVLAITVYVFYRKEKKEDEQKKQEQAHLFSFDAL